MVLAMGMDTEMDMAMDTGENEQAKKTMAMAMVMGMATMMVTVPAMVTTTMDGNFLFICRAAWVFQRWLQILHLLLFHWDPIEEQKPE